MKLAKRSTVFLITAIVVSGCARQDPLAPVIGVVTLKGKPLNEGSISLRPDGQRGNVSLHHPTGRIEEGGRFEIFTQQRSGAVPGWYKIVVFANAPVQHNPASPHPGMPQTIIHPKYNTPTTTPLSVEVTFDAAPDAYHLDVTPP